MAEPCVRIAEYTDPACPWAYSAEPFRRRLDWLYEGRLEWLPRMVVLADTPEDFEKKGLDPEHMARSHRRISRDHGMPIDTRVRPRVSASRPACLAVVAARREAGDAAGRRLLRCLRVHYFSGEALDEPATIAAAARDAGLDPADVEGWTGEEAVEAELEEDMRAARRPSPAARVLDHKLANWSGGQRYTCPSYEITRVQDGATIAVPGFQPFAAYDVVLANLVPGLDRREAPESAEEVLTWAGTPLATQEVAVVCDVDFDSAREELGRVAAQRTVGADGFWTLPAGDASRAAAT